MSPSKETAVTCRACGHEQNFTTWSSVNVTLDPDLKQKLLNGSLTAFCCDQCGETTNVKHSLVYHDMQAKLMIWLAPDEKKAGDLPPLAASMAVDGLVLRRVDSLNGLIEKVRIAEDGLDDRLIEVLKLILREKLPEERKQGKLQLLYDQTVEDVPDGPQISFAAFTGEGTSSLLAPKHVYDRLVESMSSTLADFDQQGWKWLDVDVQCAALLMEKIAKQGQDEKEKDDMLISRLALSFVVAAIVVSTAVAAGDEKSGDGKPVLVIFDTDIQGDVDDVGAVAVLHALADLGAAKILAMGVSAKHPSCVPCLDAVNTYFGRPDVPIGVNKGKGFLRNSKYARQIADEFPHDLRTAEEAPDAAVLYRRVLARQPDRSVVMVSVGQVSNFASLLQADPDAHSDLGGVDLARRKVKAWVCMVDHRGFDDCQGPASAGELAGSVRELGGRRSC